MSSPIRQVVADALRRRMRPVVRLAAWSAAEALPALLTGYLTARAVDDGFLAGRPDVGLAWLGALAVAVLIGAVSTGRTLACLGDIVEPFRDELASRVVAGALHGSTGAGTRPDTAAATRLTEQVEIVRDSFAGLILVVRGFLFTSGAALVGLLSLAPLIAAVVTVPLLAGLALFAGTLPAMAARQREYVQASERLGESVHEALVGHRDVLACGGQETVTGAVGVHVDLQARAERRLARMAALRSLSLALGGWLPLAALVLVAPWLTWRGVTAGTVVGALVYVSTGLQPALRALVQGVANGGVRFAVTLDRILRASTPSGQLPDLTSIKDLVPRPYAPVELRAVTFRYGEHVPPVLSNFHLVLPYGEHLAVVGPSGAGKSTLATLMAGLLTAQSGTVTVGGVRVSGQDQSALAALRALIPQEAYVFTGSLADNLRYLSPNAPDEQVHAAVDALGLRPMVDRLGGLTAPVDPATLSAGERQLVALVRAYLSPAPLVILDEATCHLDPTAEARVEQVFAARPGILVVVAHRISSALRARRVLILDGEQPLLGSHQDLVLRSSTYRELVGHWHPAVEALRQPDLPLLGSIVLGSPPYPVEGVATGPN